MNSSSPKRSSKNVLFDHLLDLLKQAAPMFESTNYKESDSPPKKHQNSTTDKDDERVSPLY